ncbi:MAG: hypothetical protein GF421_11785 [Candidatus Aminicenantes bacterium]|nr:hypothetical protein [Candidatus Aminicenantes bacterium]
MKRNKGTLLFLWIGVFFLGTHVLWSSGIQCPNGQESWMGIYIQETKVGYSYSCREQSHQELGFFSRTYHQTRMILSRLGGKPVEMVTSQESVYDEEGHPLQAVLKTKMSEQETEIRAEIKPQTIVFKVDGKKVKEISCSHEIFLEVPVEKLIHEDKFRKGAVYFFDILDPIAYSLAECRFEIIEKEHTRVLGKDHELWHTRSRLSSLVPVVTEEWIDDNGEIHKSETQTGFMKTISLKMPRKQALERAEKTYDVAFSSIIKPDKELNEPQSIQSMTVRLTGIPRGKLSGLVANNSRQRILQETEDTLVLQVNSILFHEDDAVRFPLNKETFKSSLRSTVFCQSDDPEIRAAAEKIIGEETNSWKAAKKIARWIRHEVKPNYQIGFASAKEVLQNREGDCTESTVLFTALCRSVGIPARALMGVMYGEGFFAYHMWPEVYAGKWIDLDPKWYKVDPGTGYYYTDATHIKLGRTDLDEDLFRDMVQSTSELLGRLDIKIMEYR